MNRLLTYRSWKLERISPTTYVKDIATGMGWMPTELASMAKTIRDGNCYRCKLGRGRWYFGASVEEAIENAIKNEVSSDEARCDS